MLRITQHSSIIYNLFQFAFREMKNLLPQVERLLRGICFLYHFIVVCSFLAVEVYLRPLWSKLDDKLGGFFSKNFKRRHFYEYGYRFFEQGMFWLFGIHYIADFKTEIPKSKHDNVILMFSHGSNLDPPLIHITWPYYSHFVAKKDLFKIPLVGFLLRMGGQIPIDRDNLKSAIGALDSACLMAIEEKKTLSIAPEGTRRRSPSSGPDELLPFKKGPFHVAKTAKVDIVPVAIIGANRLFKPGQMMPTPGTVIIRYLERIPKETVEKLSVEELQEEVRKKIQEGLTPPVSDEVIFNTDNKPYVYFFIVLTVLYLNLSFLIRIFL